MLRWQTGEGTHRQARGSEMWFKATSADTQGRFSLMERTLPPGGSMPPTHAHINHEEAYFVLSGTVQFHVAGEIFDGSAGTFVLVAPGESHTFGNTSSLPAHLLVLHAPGLDDYFRELELLWRGAEPDFESQIALMRRHGMEPM